MTFIRVVVLLEALVIAAVAARWARAGYRRRRTHWTRGSWIRFGLTFGTGLVALIVPVAAELAIEVGYAWREGMSGHALKWYALAAVALMMIGACITVMALGWFARGEPTRQFPGAKTRIDPLSV